MIVDRRQFGKLLVAGTTLPLLHSVSRADTPVKVLVLAAKTGPGSNYGIAHEAAARTSIAQINAAGGVLGRQIEVVTMDTGTDPAKAAVAFQTGVTNESPALVWTGTSNGETMAVAPIAVRNKVLLMSSSDVPALNDPAKFRYAFSMQNPANKKFEALSAALAALKVKKIGMMLATDATGETTFKLLPDMLKQLGVTITTIERYNATDLDMTSQIRRVDQTDPELIYIDGGGVALAYVLKGMIKLDMKRPIIGGVAMAAAPIETLVETEKLPPTYVFNFAIGHRGEGGRGGTPLVKEALPSFIQNSGGKLTTALFLYAFAYDGMKAWAYAANKAGSLDPDKIIAEFESWEAKPVSDVKFMATDNYTFSSTNHLPTPGAKDFNFGRIGTLDEAGTRESAVPKLG